MSVVSFCSAGKVLWCKVQATFYVCFRLSLCIYCLTTVSTWRLSSGSRISHLSCPPPPLHPPNLETRISHQQDRRAVAPPPRVREKCLRRWRGRACRPAGVSMWYNRCRQSAGRLGFEIRDPRDQQKILRDHGIALGAASEISILNFPNLGKIRIWV